MDKSLWLALIATLVVIGAIGAACLAVGRPDWFVITLICGLTFLLFVGGGIAAARCLSSDISEPIHRWSLVGSPFAVAIVFLIARTQYTPAEFTPNAAAHEVEIAEIDHNLEPFAGRKIRFTGEYAKLLGRTPTVTRLGIHDAKTNSWAAIEVPTALPGFKVEKGQTLEFVGVIEQSRVNGSLRLVAHDVKLIAPAIAIADH
jgi:hypothetical protein